MKKLSPVRHPSGWIGDMQHGKFHWFDNNNQVSVCGTMGLDEERYYVMSKEPAKAGLALQLCKHCWRMVTK